MTPVRERTPLFGTSDNRKEALIAVAGSLALTYSYMLLAKRLDTQTSYLEFWSLVFSFACVWLSRTENLYSMHTGIVSSIYMGIFIARCRQMLGLVTLGR